MNVMKLFIFWKLTIASFKPVFLLKKKKKGNEGKLRQHHKFWQAFVNDAFYSAWERALSSVVSEITAKWKPVVGTIFLGLCYKLHTEVQWQSNENYYSKSNLLWVGVNHVFKAVKATTIVRLTPLNLYQSLTVLAKLRTLAVRHRMNRQWKVHLL